MEYYCKKTNKELRVLPVNPDTGAVDPQIIDKYVDENTALLSVMSASNVTGSIMDIQGIVKKAREINPSLYIISDAVQHAPHAVMEAKRLGLDGMNFAPYKFFGIRGCGFAYVSKRVANLPHRKLIKKPSTVFELGTSAPANFLAAQEIINYVAEIGNYFIQSEDKATLFREGMHRIHLHERALLHRLLEGSDSVKGLRHIRGVKVHADNKDLTKRDLIAGISIEGISHQNAVIEYEKRGVIVCDRVRTSIYAERILCALEIEGAIRVSPLHCHSFEDIDEFLEITEQIANLYKNG
jgi:selenocysteine lyase/cysteine desulfurase